MHSNSLIYLNIKRSSSVAKMVALPGAAGHFMSDVALFLRCRKNSDFQPWRGFIGLAYASLTFFIGGVVFL